MRVIKRNGGTEEISFDKVLRRIRTLWSMEPCLSDNVSPDEIAQKVCGRIYDGVHTSELDELAAQICATLVTYHPDYGTLAARIAISNHHKNTSPSFSETISVLYNATDVQGKKNPLVSNELWEVTQANKEKINAAIDYDRDYANIDYFGFKTLERSYLLKVNGKPVERPQHLFMRVALGIHGGDIKDAIETYELMSKRYFTHATPTLFNAGTPMAQLSSCYLLGIDDSVTGMYKTIGDCAQISKYAGGIGVHAHDIRAHGSHIRGTNGTSSGIIPMLRVFNTTARHINQAGKRAGSIAIYLEPWHADIEAFLDIRKNTGAEEARCRDLFSAMWIPDLFMRRVQANEEWSLMCPDECPGLSDVYGNDFDSLYEGYEAAGKYRKKVKAQHIWFAILKACIEGGTPYICFKDHVNRASNQSNVSIIKSSNLCVAPETLVLTDQGYFPIKDLQEQEVSVWNGYEFSKVIIKQTGKQQKLITIGFSNGMEVRCTPYHKFYIQTGSRNSKIQTIEAKDLKMNMKITRYSLPTLNSGTETMKSPYTHGLFCAEGTYSKSKPNRNNEGDQKQCSYTKYNGTEFCSRHQHYRKTFNNAPIPLLSLYGVKKQLLPFIDHVYSSHSDNDSPIVVGLHHDIKEKYYVPLNGTIDTKMRWLEGYLDGDGCIVSLDGIKNIQVSSVEKDFIQNVLLMLQTLGVNAKISLASKARKKTLPDGNDGYKDYMCKNLWRLNIDCASLIHLASLGFSPKRLDISNLRKPRHVTNSFIKVTKVEDVGEYDDTYCFNEPLRHAGIFNGVLTGQCSEITEVSNTEETAVCNLASIALPSYIQNGTFDFALLHKIVQVVTRNLEKVIDKTLYPIPEARLSNLRHRPMGIGVQGLADVYAILRMPFDSPEAAELNKQIFATIYHAAVTASVSLSKIRNDLLEEVECEDTTADRKKQIYDQLHLTDEEALLKQYRGAYSTFNGSPASQGKLQFDLWGVQPLPEVPGVVFDWEKVKADIKQYGMRNSLLVALMPTASTSQIMGFNEAMEPFTSNIYQRQTLAGEFTIINKYLVADLIKLGLWSQDMKDRILTGGGSVQHINEIPEDLRALYKTVWEIKQKVLIDQSADRGIYVCQSQSLNLFAEDVDFNKLSSMHFYGWKRGLKTGCYYLRTRPKARITAYTLDAKAYSPKNSQSSRQSQNDSKPSSPTAEEIMACRRDNPEACLMCGS